MHQRRFLKHLAATAAVASFHSLMHAEGPRLQTAKELTADVVVIGGGVGGVAAALAAVRQGMSVILSEETDWLGGQLTSQAVPPDEHPWIESFGCTRSYRQFRDGVRNYYRRHYPLSPEASAASHLNPGNGWVSRLCHEPRVALAVIGEMLAPYVAAGRLRVLLNHRPVAVATQGDRVTGVSLRDQRSGRERVITGPFVIDATELGDVIGLGKVEHVTGAESIQEHGEPHAPAEPSPEDEQAFTVCFAMDYNPGEDHVIERPASYDFWRDYAPKLSPAWPGKLLSWETSDPITLKPRTIGFDPTERIGARNLWTYRRLVDSANFVGGAIPRSVCLVNWPQNDYWLAPVSPLAHEQRLAHWEKARELSRSLFYWMQTEAPRPDGGTGWKGLRLRGDITGSEDGLAMAPYIRESRRIRAEFTVIEQHLSANPAARVQAGSHEAVTAARFSDSVGVGCYRIDLHPSTGGRNYVDLSSLPFQIPLGALLPRRVENLLAGCKNIGSTHITNGAMRLHPVEWNIGEAAGALAAFCRRRGKQPREVRSVLKLLEEFQQSLRQQGFELEWPRTRPV